MVRAAPTVLAGLGVWRTLGWATGRWGAAVAEHVKPGLGKLGHTLRAASWVGQQ